MKRQIKKQKTSHDGTSEEKQTTRSICFFDIETTGFPITKGFDSYHSPHMTDFYDSSRVIEIAYIISSNDGTSELCRKSFLIKPDGFVVKNSHIHGITQETLIAEGRAMRNVLIDIYTDWEKVDSIVGHNVNFDYNVLLSECYRYGYTELADLIKSKMIECTMKMGKAFLNVKKYPKLVELYQTCTGLKELTQSHRALDDVEWCKTCYFHIRK